MGVVAYKYSIEQCDVDPRHRRRLERYRAFRAKCLEMLRGGGSATVTRQMHDLAWDTAVFQTLNEARRLEPKRAVNGAMWDLLLNGYVSRMVLGIRRLVDQGESTTGLRAILQKMRRQHELLTREHYVCHDGLPFDPRPVREKFWTSQLLEPGKPKALWLSTEGPEAFGTSERAHETFDKLCDVPLTGHRDERISVVVLDRLEEGLNSPEIQRVKALADKRFAHSEHLKPGAEETLKLTFNDLEEALRHVAVVANFISSNVLFDADIGTLVPTAQFNQLEALEQGWVTPETIPALQRHWSAVEERLNQWAYDAGASFYPERASVR